MRRSTRTSLIGGATMMLAATGIALAASPASAVEEYSACVGGDSFNIVPGTPVVFTFPAGCALVSFEWRLDGPIEPSLVWSGAGTAPLLWSQSIGRASADATCPQGWDPSWAQWPNDGKGGFTCDRDVVWGTTPSGENRVLTVIGFNDDDEFDLFSSDGSGTHLFELEWD